MAKCLSNYSNCYANSMHQSFTKLTASATTQKTTFVTMIARWKVLWEYNSLQKFAQWPCLHGAIAAFR